jgi:hypothetical protein
MDMKTPTILVRLVGLYLLVQCAVGLVQIAKFKATVGGFMMANSREWSTVAQMQWLLVVGLVVGIAATGWAGPLARLLTFDAEPRNRRSGTYRDFL